MADIADITTQLLHVAEKTSREWIMLFYFRPDYYWRHSDVIKLVLYGDEQCVARAFELLRSLCQIARKNNYRHVPETILRRMVLKLTFQL